MPQLATRPVDSAGARAVRTAVAPPVTATPAGDWDAVSTLAQLFAWRLARTPEAEAYRQYDEAQQRWVGMSWGQTAERVGALAAALSAMELARGTRVAILLPNGCTAVCLDQAVLARACVPVPMHALDNPASIAYILADSEAALLVAESDAQWSAIAGTGVALPALRQVVLVQHIGPPAGLAQELAGAAGAPTVLGLAQWLVQAPAGLGAQPSPLAAGDLAAVVYTSGTTGKPKGVMLTHGNVVSNVKAVLQRVLPGPDECFLSFLPLSHTLERTAGYYLPMAAGACVAFARGTKFLAQDLQSVRPTILISVPRIYERVYAALGARLAPASLRRWLFERAQSVGWRRFCRRQGLVRSGAGAGTLWDSFAQPLAAALDALAWPLLDRLVARTLREQFGGRLRLAVSGGAPLSEAVAHCFLGLGLPILQGYGMTETAPVVAVNGLDDNDPATVGRALAGVEVRIGADRELQVRGPNVMRGYWKRDEDTARSFTEGWLRTGDQASIEDGRIRILGRIKEIIVTSTGEKIAPGDLELAITTDPAFESAYAFGDNRPFIACVVVLGRAYWESLAAAQGLDPKDPASLRDRGVREAVLERVRDLTRAFPRYAQPRAVLLTLEAWTVENSLLTPTLKLKRNNLAAHFAQPIEQLY